MKKFASSLLLMITLFIVGSAVLPTVANAQPRRRYHHRYYRHHRPYHRGYRR
ncbi:hypothetical protein [Terriglobus roseus]|uniref:Uncharacterized protein n=1 Tax=Terriglobus roseus TaxID=392734 RepID=A0A1H4T0U9_9BACT|nr:hypothetical protein [Terriglobus roseus]SEC49804.1 hypothetical protein SAMN05443244_3607 [Terriglobus roseus]